MGFGVVFGVVVALAVVLGSNEVVAVKRFALQNEGIYTFQNVGDRQFLTNPLGSNLIVTAGWSDAPTQKWQVSKGYLYTSYMIKPVADGIGAKVAIDASRTSGGYYQVTKAPYTFGVSNALYWSIIPAEGTFYMLQNLDNDLCLESTGYGQPVTVSQCRLAQSQQWAVHQRPR